MKAEGAQRPGVAEGPDDFLSPQEIRLMAEVGFVAVVRGMADDAERIFRALRPFSPKGAFVFVGLALVALLRCDLLESARVLEEGMKTGCDDQQLLKVFHTFSLFLAGQSGAAARGMRDLAGASLSHGESILAEAMGVQPSVSHSRASGGGA